MTHGRKPRQKKRVVNNVFGLAMRRATRHTAAELERMQMPLQEAHTALREGVATEIQWACLCTAVNVALAIEDLRVVRGLRGHFQAAERSLHGIGQRAMASGDWKPTALYYEELDNVAEAVRLHGFQLEQLSAGELERALKLSEQRNRTAGGRVIVVAEVHQGMLV